MWKMGWRRVVGGQSRSQFDRAHTITYQSSIITMSESCTVSEI